MSVGKKASKKSTSGGGKTKGYGADDIVVLEGLEAVQRRPGMYIGTTGIDGLYHLVWEVFDNSLDEAMGGHAHEIEITLLPDDVVRVADNGRGIPVDTHAKTKVSALETIMTTLHAGGKFGNAGYKVSGGLHGVGVSVVNALSTTISALVHRDGSIYFQEYHYGKVDKKIKVVGKTKESGTVITFHPDPKIFKEITFTGKTFELERIAEHVRDQAFLVKQLRIRVVDLRQHEKKIPDDVLFVSHTLPNVPSYTFYFDGGLSSFIRHHNADQKPIHQDIFSVDKEVGTTRVTIALQYVNDISSRIFGFGNNIRNIEGGTHITGLKTALTRSMNSYAKGKKLVKEGETFSGEDVLEGLTAIVAVQLPDIQFEGQTKAKLGSVEARSAVETIFNEAFGVFLEENPTTAKVIIAKVSLAYQARKAARAAKDSILRKGALEGMTLPGKLGDCQTKNSDEAELFIVEGDSAGGTAKQGRDRRTQAVLPLRGKILNVERARLDRALTSDSIKSVVIALGTAIGDAFNIEKLRYGKVIITTDADVDGAHIRTLLLTLFYRFFRDLVENGNIYFAQPPLYKVKKGKEIRFAFSDAERDVYITELQKGTKETPDEKGDEKSDEGVVKTKGILVQRYKGLGEMNHGELWETTMDPEKRTLKQVTIADAAEADKTFDILMGAEVAPRRAFIQTNAKYATLDI